MKHEIFETNPNLKEVHMTSDGECFYNENDAKMHAKSLEDKKVEIVFNGDHIQVEGDEEVETEEAAEAEAKALAEKEAPEKAEAAEKEAAEKAEADAKALAEKEAAEKASTTKNVSK
jgi:hypothetical protein